MTVCAISLLTGQPCSGFVDQDKNDLFRLNVATLKRNAELLRL